MRLSFLLFKAKKDAAFICICIYTYIGNLSQNASKIIIGLDCQNLSLCHFCLRGVVKGCKVG